MPNTPPLTTSVNQTISMMIDKESQRVGSYTELEKKIKEANSFRPKKKTINHQKLRALGDSSKNHSIYFEELEILDTYFRTHGISLAKELFQPPTLIEALGNSGPVTFLIPSRNRKDEMRADMSEWDVKALAEFTYSIGQSGTRQPKINIQEVPYRPELFEAESLEFSQEEWFKHLKGDIGATVSISSPRASHSSELMLSEMFGFEPMSPNVDLTDLPFAFVWPNQKSFRSSFSVSLEKLKQSPEYQKQLGSVADDSYLLVANGKIYESKRSGDGLRHEYGVLIAQFHQSCLQVCTAGCTGSSGLGVVQAAREFIISSREFRAGLSAEPVWAIVEVDILPTRNAADPRKVVGHRILPNTV